MIIICEPQCAGFEHVEFNAALIATVRSAFPEEEISFYAEREHLALVKAELTTRAVDGIAYFRIEIPPRTAYAHRRFPAEMRLYRHIFDTAKDLGIQRILFSSTTGPGLIAMKVHMRRYRHVRCVVVPHSDLESLMKKRPSLKPFVPSSYLDLPFWFRFSFLYGNGERLKYLVLGQSIKEQICLKYPKLEKIIRSVDHPYFYRESDDFIPFRDGVIRFGSLGVGVGNKGIDLFIKMGEEFCHAGARNKPEFIHIGPLSKKVVVPKSSPVKIPSHYSPLNRKDYDFYASSIDYAVFLYKRTSYRLSASGTLFDAFSYLKPVIALKTPFFEYYFKTMGDIGYLCNDYREIKEVVIRILNETPLDRYAEQRNNILRGRERLRVPELAKGLVDLWED